MADRTIKTVLELNASRFVSGAAAAGSAAKALAKEINALEDNNAASKRFDKVANTLLGIGTAAAAGMGVATKAALDWESAWAGVSKTVDGSKEEMAALEDGLRGLARELPASHEEIAAVAEAAGQLGVARDDVVDFTRTMINLGETTNLTADEAATSIAQFANVMGTAGEDIDNLGAALVALGNDGASTEAEIMNMAQRLSGAGAMIGASEQDIMGLSSALASVGISAEAGGGALSRVLQKINTEVLSGGDSLAEYAKIAGVSADEFAAKWQASPVQALDLLLKGLNGVRASGGDAAAMLKDLGIRSSEETRSLLSLAGAGDLLAKSLDTANSSWAESTALVAEAAKRYETTEAKIQIARNALTDSAIDIGGNVLPILAGLAESVAGAAEAFGNLPAPAQQAITVFGLVAGAGGLLVGGLMKVAPVVGDTIGSFKRLREESPRTAAALGKVAKGVGVATAAFTAASTIAAYGDSLTDFTIGANEAADAALRLAESKNPWQDVFKGMGQDAELASASAEELAANLDVLANGHWYEGISNLETGVRNAFGANLATTDDFRERLDAVGNSITGIAESDLPKAQEAFRAMWEQAGGTESAGTDLLELMPTYKDHLIGVANAAELATDDATLLKIATGDLKVPVKDVADGQKELGAQTASTTDDMSAQVEQLTELQELLQATADILLKARSGERDFEASIDAANDALKENGKTLDLNTEKGRANQEALDGIASSALKYAGDAMEAGASTEELNGILKRGRDEFIKTAEKMGMSKTAAESLADQLQLIPGAYKATVEVDSEEAKEAVTAVGEAFAGLDGAKASATVDINSEYAVASAEEAKQALEGIPSVTSFIKGDNSALETTVNKSNLRLAYLEAQKATPTVELDDTELINVTQAAVGRLNELDRMEPTPRITAEKESLERVVAGAKERLDSIPDTTIAKVQAETGGERDVRSLRDAISEVRSKNVTITTTVKQVGDAFAAWGKSFAGGGWLNGGLSGGGWVPGKYPGAGVDNVLWPVAAGAAGGRFLSQPLAGTEYVVNGRQSRMWGPALEAINSGLRPQDLQAVRPVTTFAPVQHIHGPDALEVATYAAAMTRHDLRDMAVTLP